MVHDRRMKCINAGFFFFFFSRELYFADMDMEDDIMLNDEVPSISDLIRDCQYENNFHLGQLMDNCDWLYNTSSSSPQYTGDEVKTIEEGGYDEDSNDSPVSIREKPPISLFKEAKHRQRPWSKSFAAPSNYFLSNCIYVV